MNIQAMMQAAIAEEPNVLDSSPAPVVGVVTPEKETGPCNDETIKQPARQLINIKPLNEKATLVKLRQTKFNPYLKDQDATDEYGAGNVNKHLFSDSNNLVKKTIAAFAGINTYVNNNTTPWDVGVRMLNMLYYIDFTAGYRAECAKAFKQLDVLCDNWEDVKTADYHRVDEIGMRKGNFGLAKWSDYPSVEALRAKFTVKLNWSNLPAADGFDLRFGISQQDVDEIVDNVQQQISEAEQNGAKHVLQEMIKPMEKAAEKLAIAVGQDGSVFRDGLVQNLVDTADRANRINLSDDPELQQRINDLSSLGSRLVHGKEMLRHSQTARTQAKDDIDALMTKMKGLV